MATEELEAKLVSYIQDAHAMEVNVLQMVGSMIASTADPELKKALETHKTETERHERSLRECLEAHNAKPAVITKEIPSMIGAMVKGIQDQVRTDKPGKNARDGFVTEHLEIAAYELLERLAERAGDGTTAEVARRNRADEERMANTIAASWDKVVDLTLKEAGIAA
jgi:ferritin-like metal-binding protein YciE